MNRPEDHYPRTFGPAALPQDADLEAEWNANPKTLRRLWDLIGWGDRIAFRNSELRMVRAIAWYRSVPCPEAPGGTVGLWGPEERKCCFNQAAMRHRTLW